MHRSIRRSIENKFMSHYHQMLVCQLSRNCHNKHGWGIDRQGKNKCCLICISVIQITYFYILLSICFPMLIIKADLYLPNKTKCDLVCHYMKIDGEILGWWKRFILCHIFQTDVLLALINMQYTIYFVFYYIVSILHFRFHQAHE